MLTSLAYRNGWLWARRAPLSRHHDQVCGYYNPLNGWPNMSCVADGEPYDHKVTIEVR
jgi:hypothetical protein